MASTLDRFAKLWRGCYERLLVGLPLCIFGVIGCIQTGGLDTEVNTLVTGASGQIGSYLVPLLEHEGHKVYTSTLDLVKSGEKPDMAFVLHIVRPHNVQEVSLLSMLNQGLIPTIALIDTLTHLNPQCRIVVAGTSIMDQGVTSWHRDRLLTQIALGWFPTVSFPLLDQYVSSKVNPKRQYLGQILYDLAKGTDPKPERPDALVWVNHASYAARQLYYVAVHNGWDSSLTSAEEMTIWQFIQKASHPGHWLNDVVKEIKRGLK